MATQTKKGVQTGDQVQFLKKLSLERRSASVPEKQSRWLNASGTSQIEDNGLLVTHVNQTQDLLKVLGRVVKPAAQEDSREWLKTHSLESKGLSLAHLLSQGTVVLSQDNSCLQQIEFPEDTVSRFESQLYEAIELYHQRIQWLMEGSRKVFGLIKGTKVGILIDSSEICCGPRKQEFQTDLLCLIDEQLSHKKQLYFLSFGTELSTLWTDPVEVNLPALCEARQWVQALQPCGGCNLLKALRKAFTIRELNSLVIIMGSCPDQSSEILSDYIQQVTLGRDLIIHIVTYECSSYMPLVNLQNFSEAVGGRYHCYSSALQNFASSDVDQLLCEAQKAKILLNYIEEMYQSRSEDNVVTSTRQGIFTEVADLPHSSCLPKPPKHDSPLKIETPNFLTKTSADWLKTNGLKAKQLNLYQVLAPNAFSPVEEFVPILQKTVSSTLHERAMVQFEWHDGTVKNVHVDPPILYEYQKQLGRAVRTYERRIEWLSIASRRIWGTVCEKRVVILVDISVTNSMYIIHIQHSLRLLLEEQMSNKDFFNITAFGSEIESWRPELAPINQENLQSAWRWVLSLECGGSRNIMSAVRKTVEVDLKEKDKHTSQGIYLFTGGVPDQEVSMVSAYVAEVCGGCDLRLHICLFHIGGSDLDGIIPARYASMDDTASAFKEIAQAANGRFHWFGDVGIYESDDISAIMAEMEEAINFSQKCAALVGSLKSRAGSHLESKTSPKGDGKMLKERSSPQKFFPPKPTALTLARMNIRDSPDREKKVTVKALTWRPTSAGGIIPPTKPVKEWSQPGRKKKAKAKKRPETSLSVFYIDKGRNVGVVYRKYPKRKSVRKAVPSVVLPTGHKMCSTREWLNRYSLKKLKLELPKLMFGPNCTHQKKMVATLQKQVSAKYCNIFPSVEVNGIVKHLQFQSRDLEEYITQTEKVVKCYVRRMQWLLSGSRRLFGTILERKVCILLDTSGSMGPCLQMIKKELTLLIWEQLRTHCDSFTLLSFADSMAMWQECLVEVTDDTCHDAVQWVSKLRAQGSTCVLKALQKAFCVQDVKGLYLLSDGKPDTSCSLILKEVEKLTEKRDIKIHTISFNCSDGVAIRFLKKLASLTGGRYHHCHGDIDGHFAAYRLLTEGFSDEDDPILPLFEGDDLKELAQEVAKARHFLVEAQSFRLLLKKKNLDSKDKSF
ncbi:von Willebrand factor A domain-containing protein 3A [Tachyglossus aculeatus]|uniref:von Willebrand factor A domain-containing protein 3A n=1 Tax=Tachyglossus aculeatus TaxID=9261 RepID=UPI0018F38D43|nr:von Willebrand factor A domain-containing protein 3A [Tachyglossus aculeatus]